MASAFFSSSPSFGWDLCSVGWPWSGLTHGQEWVLLAPWGLVLKGGVTTKGTFTNKSDGAYWLKERFSPLGKTKTVPSTQESLGILCGILNVQTALGAHRHFQAFFLQGILSMLACPLRSRCTTESLGIARDSGACLLKLAAGGSVQS